MLWRNHVLWRHFYHKSSSNIKWVLLFLLQLNDELLLKVWVWYICQNSIKSYYQSPWWRTINFLSRSTAYQNTQADDGEQLTFYQEVLHIKTHRLRKEQCFRNLFIAFTWQKLCSRQIQMPHSAWRKLPCNFIVIEQ